MSEKHLWEVDHPYYCAEGNFYASSEQPFASYKTWAEFAAAEAGANMDYNLVFRWDWREGAEWDLCEFTGDRYYRNGRLLIFFMGQRKGLYRWAAVEVCRADEPAVRAFLEPRFRYLLSLWEPFGAPAAAPIDGGELTP